MGESSIEYLTKSSVKVRATMDLFQHRYYRLNKTLLKLMGYWPYQSTRVRVVITVVALSLCVSQVVPQVIAIVKNLDDWNFIMKCAVPVISDFFCLTKGLSSLFNWRKMLKLLNHMRKNWEVWARDPDVDILHEYAEKGRKMTIAYTVMASTIGFFYVTQPVMPKIIDVLLKNGTEPGQFPVPVDYYYIDMQKYYFYVILHCYVYTSLAFLILIACDCMFMVHVQHSCGLFAALGRKLGRIGTNEKSTERGEIAYGSVKPVMEFEYLASCIDKHNDAIKYAELIDATYSWCFFLIVGLNMLLISVIGIQITTNTNEPEETIKFILSIAMAMVHLYIECYMGQILMDHSISIRYYILKGKWYSVPLKAQKLLPLMMMRCNVPCKVTIGKTAIMSVQVFSVILKTSLSYFTLLRSV